MRHFLVLEVTREAFVSDASVPSPGTFSARQGSSHHWEWRTHHNCPLGSAALIWFFLFFIFFPPTVQCCESVPRATIRKCLSGTSHVGVAWFSLRSVHLTPFASFYCVIQFSSSLVLSFSQTAAATTSQFPQYCGISPPPPNNIWGSLDTLELSTEGKMSPLIGRLVQHLRWSNCIECTVTPLHELRWALTFNCFFFFFPPPWLLWSQWGALLIFPSKLSRPHGKSPPRSPELRKSSRRPHPSPHFAFRAIELKRCLKMLVDDLQKNRPLQKIFLGTSQS